MNILRKIAPAALACLTAAIAATSCHTTRTADLYITTAAADRLFDHTQPQLRHGSRDTLQRITIDTAARLQPVYGFGAAITGSTCYNLLRMTEAGRDSLLRECFDPQRMAFSFIRISIGASDFSLDEYTCCDREGIEFFGLHEYDRRDLIPILQRILEINPSVKIVAAPWSCPKWMKIGYDNDRPLDSWTDGRLNPQYYDDYAEYFVLWIAEMEAAGIPVYAVSVQNEPLNRGNSMSLYMGWEQQRDFIRDHLGPAFERNGIETKIWLFDHNYNYDNIAGQQDYPLRILADTAAARYVAGTAWHNYGGSPETLDGIHAAYPDKEIFFTEASIGTWNYDFGKCLVNDFASIFLGTLNRYGRGVTLWNLLLDDKGAPNRPKGCRTCYGAVEISSETYDYATLVRKSHYYDIAHCSKVIMPGAVRVGSESGCGDAIPFAAFANPDGSYALVAANLSEREQAVEIAGTGSFLPLVLPPRSVASARWRE